MVEFLREALETFKYADLVKLAKEHDVYRRYAPKTELVEKLMALSEPTLETLNDVSMPSFMENDETESDEHSSPNEHSALKENYIRINDSSVKCISPRAPLGDKGKIINFKLSVSKSESPISGKSSTSQASTRSLAGPAKTVNNVGKLKRQTTSDVKNKTDKQPPTPHPPSRRLTRQQTFDVEGKESNKHQMKREGTFDVEVTKSESKKKEADVVNTKQLRREGTFEVDEKKKNADNAPRHPHTRKFRREGTFELESTTVSRDAPEVSNEKPASKAAATSKAKATPNRLSYKKQPARMSLRSPYLSKIAIATPNSLKPLEKDVNGQSVPRRFITSRSKPLEISLGGTASASKSKIPSLMNEIQLRKAEVSAKKILDAMEGKPVPVRKAPDFNSIHQRMFGKMESIVDSRQKIIDKVNSMQKLQQMCEKRNPAGKIVVRKLISPKAGKSKIASPSPKPLQHVAAAYASNIVTIQKRPSIRSVMPGVSKLQSPRFKFDAKSKGTTNNQFGFPIKDTSRKEAVKASVMGRKPLIRNSPMAKAKQTLKTVRLNKRFELQMKHRFAQQGGQ